MRCGYGINPSVSSQLLSNYGLRGMMNYSLPAFSTITTSSPTPTGEPTSTGTSDKKLDIGHLKTKLMKLNESEMHRCYRGFMSILP